LTEAHGEKPWAFCLSGQVNPRYTGRPRWRVAGLARARVRPENAFQNEVFCRYSGMDQTSEAAQMDLAYSIEKPDWVALKILTEEIQDELSQNRHNLLYCLSNWFMAVTIFKRFEERQMVIAEPTDRDRRYHRVLLTGLLANGEKLLDGLSRHSEVDTKNVGIDLGDVEAAVNEFRLCYAEWFSDAKPERKGAILKEIFGVAKSTIGQDS
jgi:hypothetical protein